MQRLGKTGLRGFPKLTDMVSVQKCAKARMWPSLVKQWKLWGRGQEDWVFIVAPLAKSHQPTTSSHQDWARVRPNTCHQESHTYPPCLDKLRHSPFHTPALTFTPVGLKLFKIQITKPNHIQWEILNFKDFLFNEILQFQFSKLVQCTPCLKRTYTALVLVTPPYACSSTLTICKIWSSNSIPCPQRDRTSERES